MLHRRLVATGNRKEITETPPGEFGGGTCNWEIVPHKCGETRIDNIIYCVDCDNQNTWIAGFQNGYAARSINDGVTWLEYSLPPGLNCGSSDKEDIYSIATDGDGKWIAGMENGYASFSENNGETWEKLERGLNCGDDDQSILCLATDEDGTWIAGFEYGYASRSLDNGETWNPLPRGLGQASGNNTGNITTIACDGNGTWIAGMASGFVSRSVNNGATWTPLDRGLFCGDETQHVREIKTDGVGVWIAVFDNGYASRSINHGTSWTALPRGLNSGSTKHIYGLDVDGFGKWIAVFGESSGIGVRSNDHGKTWTLLSDSPGLGLDVTNVTFRAIAANKSNSNWVAVANAGRASFSNSGGNLFQGLPQGLYAGIRNEAITAFGSNDETIIIGGSYGHASKSTNNGDSWMRMERYLQSGASYSKALNSVKSGLNDVWVAGFDGGYASMSNDNGEIWRVLPRGLETGIDGDITHIATDKKGIWMALVTLSSNGLVNKLARSVDNGYNWHDVEIGDQLFFNTTGIDTDGEGNWMISGAVYSAGRYTGRIIKSTNVGNSWDIATDVAPPFPNNWGDSYTSFHNLYCDRIGKWVASFCPFQSEPNTLYISEDDGATWIIDDSVLEGAVCRYAEDNNFKYQIQAIGSDKKGYYIVSTGSGCSAYTKSIRSGVWHANPLHLQVQGGDMNYNSEWYGIHNITFNNGLFFAAVNLPSNDTDRDTLYELVRTAKYE